MGVGASGTKLHRNHNWPYFASTWRIVILLALSSGLAIIAAGLPPKKEHFTSANWLVREITWSKLDRVPERLVVDVRSQAKYMEEHIPGALLLSEDTWDENLPAFLDKWNPELPVVIYCEGRNGAASKRVALRLLKDLPQARVYVLKGGFITWKAAKH